MEVRKLRLLLIFVRLTRKMRLDGTTPSIITEAGWIGVEMFQTSETTLSFHTRRGSVGKGA